MFELWVVYRYMRTRSGQFFNFVSILSIVGMALGVAALVVTMAVISGFQSTIKNSVIDVTGHILLLKRGEALEPLSTFEPKLRKLVPQIESMAPFVHVEGIGAHHGKIASIIMEGFEPATVEKTLHLKSHLTAGRFDLGTGLEEKPPILIGQELAKKLDLHVGDDFNVVLPRNNPTTKGLGFTTRVKKFSVTGLVDLGMYEYDTRFVLTSAKAAQDLADLGDSYTGLRLRLTDSDLTQDASFLLATKLGLNYVVRDWRDVNYNLFEAIKLEKAVIFVVLLFMTVAACFNISSTLFVSVMRRYGDIGIFKTLGATKGRLVRFFSLHGLVIGFIGAMSGLILGIGLCLIIAHTHLIYVPAEIYHIGHLPVELRFFDLFLTVTVAFVLCFLSTLVPALKGAKLNPVEGLKYD